MATFKSDQITNVEGSPTKFLKPSELRGRIRVGYFTFTTPAGMAIGDVINLVRLPKDARILDFILVFGAMGAGATVDIGLSSVGAGARYAAGLSVVAAGNARGTPTLDILPDNTPVPNEPTYFTATVRGAAWAAGVKLQGMVTWVVD